MPKYLYSIFEDWGDENPIAVDTDVEPTAEQYEKAAWDSGQENALWIERRDLNTGVIEAVDTFDPNAPEGERVGWQAV